VEQALARLVQVSPDNPEAWFDLGGFQAVLQKNTEAIASLRKALELSAARRARDSNAADLMVHATNDPRLTALRGLPEFQKVLGELKTAAK
jgi:cytochrome c-type biogenesis protein CcmH/NrfG